MKDLKTQLVNERWKLVAKIEKIDSFMGTKQFFDLKQLDRWHIQRQHLAMREYLDVLGYRITALEQLEVDE